MSWISEWFRRAPAKETNPPSAPARATVPTCNGWQKWLTGLGLIACAMLFLYFLLLCWPPPKPRESFTLGLLQRAVTVRPGEPATYTICGYARSGFAGPVTLHTVVLPNSPPVEYAFAPPGTEQKTGLLVPSPAGSSAVLTLHPPSGEEKSYTIMVAGTAGGQLQAINGAQPPIMSGGQTQTIAGRLVVTQHPPEVRSAAAPQQDGAVVCAFHDGLSPLSIFGSTIAPISDEMRLFLIVAIVGGLGGLLHSMRSWVYHAGHAQLERTWIPFYASTPIIGMTMAILFYLLFRAGFISPTTPAAETNTYGFAAIAGLVGLFSTRASKMLEGVADILFSKADAGAETVSPGEFSLTTSDSPRTVAPGGTATYGITVTATQDFSGSVRLTAAVDPAHDKWLTVRLNPDVITPPTTGIRVTMTAVTTAETPPGDYKITITATGGGKERRLEVILRVENSLGAGGTSQAETQEPHRAEDQPAPAVGMFTLAAPEPERTIAAGERASYVIVAAASGGFSQPVELSTAGLPAGATITLNPSTLTPTSRGISSELTVQTMNTMPPKVYEIQVRATGGGKTQETSVKLTITSAAEVPR
jgi:hypothetical protein